MILLVYFARDFLFSGSGWLGLILYYIGMCGWGGAFNVIFMVAETETPPELLGATFSLGMSGGLLSASLSPQVYGLVAMPYPLIIFSVLLALNVYAAYWVSCNSYRTFHR